MSRDADGKTNYLALTPWGAYQYARGFLASAMAHAVAELLKHPSSPELDAGLLQALAGTASPNWGQSLQTLLASRLFTQVSVPLHCPAGSMQELLPSLLARLSDRQTAMLVDDSGLCVAQSGFSAEAAQALPVLATKIMAALQHADQGFLELLGMPRGLPCLFDPETRSMVGFVDLAVEKAHFILLIQGRMQLRGDAFRDLVWILARRYG